MQIWSTKQDKYLHDLKEHVKVPLVSVCEFVEKYPRSQFVMDALFSGDIYYTVESYRTRHK